MTSRADKRAPLFSLRAALILIVVGVISFAALVVLSAFAPDLEDKDQAGLHAYSKSALGYNMAFELLRESGYDVAISRDPSQLEYHDAYTALILTPTDSGDAEALRTLDTESGYPTLIVLPKRMGLPSFLNKRHQSQTSVLDLADVQKLADALSDTVTLSRTEPPEHADLSFARMPVRISEHLQVMSGDDIVPIIRGETGVVFGRLRGTDTYILSEPELLNTHGLADIENARVAMMLMESMSGTDQGVTLVFDTTLHGFARSKDLLRTLFEPPLLGATLFAVATGLLIGWDAFLRFGRPRAEGPAIATGRQSLIESTAGLFSQTSKEWMLAADYAALVRRLALKEMGYSDDMPEDQAETLLARLEDKRRKKNPELKPAPKAEDVTSSQQLVHFAKDYHAWKKELSDECD